MTGFDERQSHAVALASLPGMTPARLARLLDGFCPPTAWHAVRAGTHPADPGRRFAASAGATDVATESARYEQAGVEVLLPGSARYPAPLIGDAGAPAVLFALGDPLTVDERSRVAVVGTRTPTPYGRSVAAEIAAGLADHEVSIVSGLAVGIDAAAHAGVVRRRAETSGAPVAVVGTGLDVHYPPSTRELWEEVVARGVIFSEAPLGTKPHPGVFPARNRIIAGLSHVVVVVESHMKGGSLYTAEAAARRSVPVCAVPGSVRSRASDGTNALLVDGCTPVRDAEDVLVAVSLARTGADPGPPGVRTRHGRPRHESEGRRDLPRRVVVASRALGAAGGQRAADRLRDHPPQGRSLDRHRRGHVRTAGCPGPLARRRRVVVDHTGSLTGASAHHRSVPTARERVGPMPPDAGPTSGE